jgi:nicotinamide-nucleotide amidase
MKGLMTEEVIPRLLSEFELPVILHQTAITFGMGESLVAERLINFEDLLPAYIKLAYLPNFGMVKLRLTAKGTRKEELEKELSAFFKQLQESVQDILVATEDVGMEALIGQLLKSSNKTLSTAESCTGGQIARMITSVPGASDYYKGTVVSYANEAKENILGVSPATIQIAGAVSEETVREMAKGARQVFNTDYAIAVSGIMGPGGGSEEKPVGTVWIAVCNVTDIRTISLALRFDRQRNIEVTAIQSLNFLRRFILETV